MLAAIWIRPESLRMCENLEMLAVRCLQPNAAGELGEEAERGRAKQ